MAPHKYIPSNLKECQVCGNDKARHIAQKYSEPAGYFVWCDFYLGECGYETKLYSSIDAACNAWNNESR